MLNQNECDKANGQDYVVCGCNNVWRDEITKAIDQGASTMEAIKEKTLASTGCGSCLPEVQRILDERQVQKGCCGNKSCCK